VSKVSQTAKKSKGRAAAPLPFTGGEDEKMRKIVDEVDRFFQSVHADIEDWKFSMEDYGDGTRIFVRFQLHINSPGAPMIPAGSKEKVLSPGTAHDRLVSRSVPVEKAESARKAPPEDTQQPDTPGQASRADSDLASFVELWRHKRDSSQGTEFHKEGAPYMDSGSEWKGRKRSGGEAPPEGVGVSSHDGSRGSDALA
jgi:hypothetical protein